MAEKDKPENPDENSQDKEWMTELTADGKREVKSPSDIKDIHKEENKGFFQTLKQNIGISKKLQERLNKEADIIKQQVSDSLQKIKEFYAAVAKAVPYQAKVICVENGKRLVHFLKECKQTAAVEVKQMSGMLKSGTKSSYDVLVGVIYRKPKQHDISVKINGLQDASKDKAAKKADKAHQVEAARRLKLAEVDKKKIKKEIEVLKKEVEKTKEGKAKKPIDIPWAEEEIGRCEQLGEVVGKNTNQLNFILRAKSKEALPEPLMFVATEHKYKELVGDGLSQSKSSQGDATKEKEAGVSVNAPITMAATVPVEIGAALKRSEKMKLKEVARGVNVVSAIQAERQQKVQVNENKAVSGLEIGLSRKAEKELKKEERQQEKVYKKLEQEKDKGITAERTVSSQERTEAEKPKAEKAPERQNQAAEEKRKIDGARQEEMAEKISHMRVKLNKLQKSCDNRAKIMSLRNGQNTNIQMTAKEMATLPSVKAEKAMQSAEMSVALPEVEKVGAISAESLNRMEKAAEKAESNLKQATLVPDYATPEFKQKAEEQGLKSKMVETEKTDQQKILALSGRPGTEAENQNQESGQQNQNEQQAEQPQFRIDPEKSKAMSAEKSGKEINMRDYQMQKMARGGRATG